MRVRARAPSSSSSFFDPSRGMEWDGSIFFDSRPILAPDPRTRPTSRRRPSRPSPNRARRLRASMSRITKKSEKGYFDRDNIKWVDWESERKQLETVTGAVAVARSAAAKLHFPTTKSRVFCVVDDSFDAFATGKLPP